MYIFIGMLLKKCCSILLGIVNMKCTTYFEIPLWYLVNASVPRKPKQLSSAKHFYPYTSNYLGLASMVGAFLATKNNLAKTR